MLPPASSSSAPLDADPLDRDSLRVWVGPTASGKSDLALEICERAHAEIISLDSMQVYRRMDIGTAKPSDEERLRVPHHMLDLVETNEVYDVQKFMKAARGVLGDLQRRNKRALFVGGTGFYLAALLRGLFEGPPVDRELREQLEKRAQVEGPEALYREMAHADPASAERIHTNDVRRVIRALEVWFQTGKRLSDWQQEWNEQKSPREAQARLVGLSFPVAMQDRRIRERAKRMLDGGWVEEARALDQHPGLGPGASQALGYDAALELAKGEIDKIQALERIALRTRQFARGNELGTASSQSIGSKGERRIAWNERSNTSVGVERWRWLAWALGPAWPRDRSKMQRAPVIGEDRRGALFGARRESIRLPEALRDAGGLPAESLCRGLPKGTLAGKLYLEVSVTVLTITSSRPCPERAERKR